MVRDSAGRERPSEVHALYAGTIRRDHWRSFRDLNRGCAKLNPFNRRPILIELAAQIPSVFESHRF
jgi:hypothetical protein